METYYLGVDGGGTKTSLCLINHKGEIIKTLNGDPSNIHAVGIEKSVGVISKLIFQILEGLSNFQCLGCLAIAGINFSSDLNKFTTQISVHPDLTKLFFNPPMIVNDTMAALRSGTTNPNAIVIISGTGSNCYGTNQRGQKVKAGGLDFILGDEGSGYWIGLEILRNVARHLDDRQKPTILTNMVFNHFKISTLEQLYDLVYQTPWNKKDIAFLASFIDQAYQTGDMVAMTIANTAVLDLINLIKTVYGKLFTGVEKVTLVKTGGTLLKNPILSGLFDSQLKLIIPNLELVSPNINAAQAAAMIAKEKWSKA